MLKTAAEMSLLSALVYKTQDEINTELLSMGWKDWYWFDQDYRLANFDKENKHT